MPGCGHCRRRRSAALVRTPTAVTAVTYSMCSVSVLLPQRLRLQESRPTWYAKGPVRAPAPTILPQPFYRRGGFQTRPEPGGTAPPSVQCALFAAFSVGPDALIGPEPGAHCGVNGQTISAPTAPCRHVSTNQNAPQADRLGRAIWIGFDLPLFTRSATWTWSPHRGAALRACTDGRPDLC